MLACFGVGVVSVLFGELFHDVHGRIFWCVGHGRFSLSVAGLLGRFLNFARGDFLHPFFVF